MRILGLDIGDKTVGVAISDPLWLTAQPVETIHYKFKNQVYKRLNDLINEYSITEIVSGLPLNMNGSEGPQAQKTRKFAEDLTAYLNKKKKSIPLVFWDERLSTIAAERVLLEADLSRAKRKKVIDKMAASLILQGYLDSRRPASQ